jgi:F-type H+-transporting ATPase subunit b
MLNATLFGQMITFSIFAWVVMKYILPQVNSALEAREREISNGLKAGEEGKSILAKATVKVENMITDGKKKVSEMLKKAEKDGENIVSQAKEEAVNERKKQVAFAKTDILQQKNQLKTELRADVALLVKDSVEKLLAGKVDESINKQLLEELIVETEGS